MNIHNKLVDIKKIFKPRTVFFISIFILTLIGLSYILIIDSNFKRIIAIFGNDYSLMTWYSEALRYTIYALIILLCIFIIFYAFYKAVIKNIDLKEEKNKLSILSPQLRDREELFRTIFEQSPLGISIGNDYNYILDINPMYEKIVGRSKDEIIALGWEGYTHPEDLEKDQESYNKFKIGEIDSYSIKKRYIRSDSSIVWVNKTIASINFNKEISRHHLCLIEDITDYMQAEAELRESERSKAVLLSNIPGIAYRCNYDREWTMQFVSEGCYDLTGYKAESLLFNKDISFNEIIQPEYREILWKEWVRVLSLRAVFKYEYMIKTATGELKWVYEQGQGIHNDNGEVEALEGLIIDITDRKLREEEIEYIIDHDFLTGLKNRRYFEKEKKKLDNEDYLPLSVIIGDINGIKFINDVFGHAEGDRIIIDTAKIISVCCRDEDIVARTGGDEFSILLPKTDIENGFRIMKKIKQAFEKYNSNITNEANLINISLGLSTKMRKSDSIEDVIRTAEDYMYKRKLLEQKSSHSAIISSIKATMFERSQETEAHAERLVDLSRNIGLMLKLTQTELDDLELLATLHDIGKIGIDDRILKKPEKLTDEEWTIMKKHPEIGYRIAMSSPELVPIAKYILSHHEYWNGKGYPQGLKGDEIPLLSRILAVVDAYDAMTEDRLYRKAMKKEEAIKEIERNSGTQFDPKIAKIFIDMISNY